jgi:hypothetical protein
MPILTYLNSTGQTPCISIALLCCAATLVAGARCRNLPVLTGGFVALWVTLAFAPRGLYLPRIIFAGCEGNKANQWGLPRGI